VVELIGSKSFGCELPVVGSANQIVTVGDGESEVEAGFFHLAAGHEVVLAADAVFHAVERGVGCHGIEGRLLFGRFAEESYVGVVPFGGAYEAFFAVEHYGEHLCVGQVLRLR